LWLVFAVFGLRENTEEIKQKVAKITKKRTL
jgi:hypothetical protein